jgi:glutamine cyclotransferase
LHCKVSELMRSKRVGIIVIGLLALATSAVMVLKRFRSATAAAPPEAVRETHAVGSVFGYEIVGEYPHDADAYTQGLIMRVAVLISACVT